MQVIVLQSVLRCCTSLGGGDPTHHYSINPLHNQSKNPVIPNNNIISGNVSDTIGMSSPTRRDLSLLSEEELEEVVRGLESRLLLAMANLPGRQSHTPS